jgi:hypothetical protein
MKYDALHHVEYQLWQVCAGAFINGKASCLNTDDNDTKFAQKILFEPSDQGPWSKSN